jgi:hypothetical protein
MTVNTEVEPALAGSRLPRWFDTNRVQGHTRLALGLHKPPPPPPRFWYGTNEFNFAAGGFRELGAGAFTRHMKSGSEDPWWPTALPVDADVVVHSDRPRNINGIILEPGENVAKAIIDEAHAQGVGCTNSIACSNVAICSRIVFGRTELQNMPILRRDLVFAPHRRELAWSANYQTCPRARKGGRPEGGRPLAPRPFPRG